MSKQVLCLGQCHHEVGAVWGNEIHSSGVKKHSQGTSRRIQGTSTLATRSWKSPLLATVDSMACLDLALCVPRFLCPSVTDTS